MFNAYIYRVSDKQITPLVPSLAVNTQPQISYAAWSPTGHQLVIASKQIIEDFMLKSDFIGLCHEE